MKMFNPQSPGETIVEIFPRTPIITRRDCARQLGLATTEFNRLLDGKISIDAELARRLSEVQGGPPEVG
jgi:plasmid maintenance system antidote protein VapI